MLTQGDGFVKGPFEMLATNKRNLVSLFFILHSLLSTNGYSNSSPNLCAALGRIVAGLPHESARLDSIQKLNLKVTLTSRGFLEFTQKATLEVTGKHPETGTELRVMLTDSLNKPKLSVKNWNKILGAFESSDFEIFTDGVQIFSFQGGQKNIASIFSMTGNHLGTVLVPRFPNGEFRVPNLTKGNESYIYFNEKFDGGLDLVFRYRSPGGHDVNVTLEQSNLEPGLPKDSFVLGTDISKASSPNVFQVKNIRTGVTNVYFIDPDHSIFKTVRLTDRGLVGGVWNIGETHSIVMGSWPEDWDYFAKEIRVIYFSAQSDKVSQLELKLDDLISAGYIKDKGWGLSKWLPIEKIFHGKFLILNLKLESNAYSGQNRVLVSIDLESRKIVDAITNYSSEGWTPDISLVEDSEGALISFGGASLPGRSGFGPAVIGGVALGPVGFILGAATRDGPRYVYGKMFEILPTGKFHQVDRP